MGLGAQHLPKTTHRLELLSLEKPQLAVLCRDCNERLVRVVHKVDPAKRVLLAERHARDDAVVGPDLDVPTFDKVHPLGDLALVNDILVSVGKLLLQNERQPLDDALVNALEDLCQPDKVCRDMEDLRVRGRSV